MHTVQTSIDSWEGRRSEAFALTLLQYLFAFLPNHLRVTLKTSMNDFPAAKQPRSCCAHEVCWNAHCQNHKSK